MILKADYVSHVLIMITQPASILAARKNSAAAVSLIAPRCSEVSCPTGEMPLALPVHKPRLAEQHQRHLHDQPRAMPASGAQLLQRSMRRGSPTDGLQPRNRRTYPA